MKVRETTALVVFVSLLLMLPAAASAARDTDHDGISDRHERLLGTSTKSYTKARHYVNRVIHYRQSSGRLTFYRGKNKPVITRVDDESTIYCGDEYYWLNDEFDDEDEFDDDFDEDFDDGFAGSAPCMDSAIKIGERIDEIQLTYVRGRFYVDTLHLR